MLSKEALWCLNLSFRNGKHFWSIPLSWNRETRVVSVSKHLLKWKAVAIVMMAYGLFAFARLIQSYFFLGVPLHKCIIQVYFVISSFYFGTAHLAYWFNYNEFAVFWTRFLEFDRTFAGSNFNGEKTDRIGLVLKFLSFMNYNHMLMQGVGFIFIRKNPNFIYSLIWEIWEVDYVWLRIVFAIFEIMIMFYSWTGCQLINVGILLYPSTLQRWNEYVGSNPDKAWKHKKLEYYRSLQLLTASYAKAYSPIALPAQEFAVLFGGIICTYATIKFYGIVPLFIYLTMPTSNIIMIFYEKYFHGGSANVTLSSEKLLQDYELALLRDAQQEEEQRGGRRLGFGGVGGVNFGAVAVAVQPITNTGANPTPARKEDFSSLLGIKQLQKKIWTSFYPLGIDVLSFYSIKRGTIMTFGSLVLGNAINLLLA